MRVQFEIVVHAKNALHRFTVAGQPFGNFEAVKGHLIDGKKWAPYYHEIRDLLPGHLRAAYDARRSRGCTWAFPDEDNARSTPAHIHLVNYRGKPLATVFAYPIVLTDEEIMNMAQKDDLKLFTHEETAIAVACVLTAKVRKIQPLVSLRVLPEFGAAPHTEKNRLGYKVMLIAQNKPRYVTVNIFRQLLDDHLATEWLTGW